MTARAATRASEASAEETGYSQRGSVAAADSTTASTFMLARQLFVSGNLKGALQLLDGEVSAGRENVDVLRLIGRIAMQLGEESRAQRALERAIALAPDDVVTHVRLVRVLLRSGTAA